MTYVFNMDPERVLIGTDMVEWEERFPQWGEGSDVTAKIVDGWRSGARPLAEDQLPKVLVARKPRPSWPDMFTTTNGLPIVSQPAKDIIDGLDPGLHQFFPLEIKTKRGLDIEGPWFAMNVTAKQDSIVLGRSTTRQNPNFPETLNYVSYEAKWVTVDPSKQTGIHLWREQRFNMSLLGSDTLVDALKASDLKFFPCFKAQDL